jgi:uncharacterized protein
VSVQRALVRVLLALAPVLAAFAPQGPAAAEAALGPDGLLPVPALARVVDQAGVLSAADRAALEARLARFESDNGAQVAILLVASTGAEPIEDFANRVGSSWKIGRRGVGDGLLLVIATHDRAARIEVARSLEGAIPDAIASRVIRQQMGPHFKAGDYAGGLNAALDELLTRIEQERLGPSAPQPGPGSSNHGVGLHGLLPVLAVAVFLGSALRRALGAGGAAIAGAGAGALASLLLASVVLGAIAGVLVFVLAMALGAAGRYGHAIGGPGGFPGPWGGGWGGGSGGGFGGGGGFSSGGGGDFSGGGASGSW